MTNRRLAVFLLSTAILAPTSAMAETIFGAMAKAYTNNSMLNASRAGVRITDEGVAIAKSGYRPTLSATADLSVTKTRLDGGRDGTSRTGTFGITVNQMLFDGFTTRNNVSAAKALVLAERENLRNTEQNQLFAAAQAYMDVYLTRQIVVLRQRNIEALDERLRSERARFEVGEGTRTDVAQAEAQRAASIAQLNLAKSNEKTAEATYIQIVGDRPGQLQAASSQLKSLPSVNAAYSIASESHPAILATRYAVDAAGYQVKAVEGELLPQVSLNGQITRDEIFGSPSALSSTGGINSTSGSASVRVEVPIYSGGRTSARVRQGKETVGQRRVEVDIRRDDVRQAVANAYAEREAALASIIAQKSAVAAAQLALRGVTEERKVGQRTALNVLEEETKVLEAQINLATAERDAVVSSYAGLLATGRLSAVKVGLNVKEHRPEEHYEAVKDKAIGTRTPDGR